MHDVSCYCVLLSISNTGGVRERIKKVLINLLEGR